MVECPELTKGNKKMAITETQKRINDMKAVINMKPELKGDYEIAQVFLKVAGEQLLAEQDPHAAFALAEIMAKVATGHSDDKLRWYAGHELAQTALHTGNDDLSALVLTTQYDRALHDTDTVVRGNASYYVGAIAEKHPALLPDAKQKLQTLNTESTDSKVLHNADAWLKLIR